MGSQSKENGSFSVLSKAPGFRGGWHSEAVTGGFMPLLRHIALGAMYPSAPSGHLPLGKGGFDAVVIGKPLQDHRHRRSLNFAFCIKKEDSQAVLF